MNNQRDQVTILERSIDQLTLMAEMVKKAFLSSLKAVFESDCLLAQDVIDGDKSINSYEIDIDNSTYSILTNTSVPGEILRALVSIQKINPILERIGDHAVNIAESAMSISVTDGCKEYFCLPEMAENCKGIFIDSLASFFAKDIDLARDVLQRDDSVDFLNVAVLKDVKEKVMENSLSFELALDIIRISKNLERIADLSINIAEETIFALAGKNCKHSAQMELLEIQ